MILRPDLITSPNPLFFLNIISREFATSAFLGVMSNVHLYLQNRAGYLYPLHLTFIL